MFEIAFTVCMNISVLMYMTDQRIENHNYECIDGCLVKIREEQKRINAEKWAFQVCSKAMENKNKCEVN